jgi:hypothetical protein
MTEAEWLASQNIDPLLTFADGLLSARQSQLFALACCRRIWHFITDERSRHAVETSELCVEGLCSQSEQERVAQTASQAFLDTMSSPVTHNAAFAAFCSLDVKALYRRQAHGAALQAAMWSAGNVLDRSDESAVFAARDAERAAQSHLLRDIFGNPFRPVAFSPAWRTDTVVALARQMYESRDFSAMPILADALQDAGCDNEEVLSHCRGPGPHVRGCWVVDLVLGKE